MLTLQIFRYIYWHRTLFGRHIKICIISTPTTRWFIKSLSKNVNGERDAKVLNLSRHHSTFQYDVFEYKYFVSVLVTALWDCFAKQLLDAVSAPLIDCRNYFLNMYYIKWIEIIVVLLISFASMHFLPLKHRHIYSLYWIITMVWGSSFPFNFI